MLKIDKDFGTLEKGKIVDLLILDGDLVQDIRNTRKINSVHKAGKEVSKGSLALNK